MAVPAVPAAQAAAMAVPAIPAEQVATAVAAGGERVSAVARGRPGGRVSVISAEPAPRAADPLAGTGPKTEADTRVGHRASVASTTSGLVGLAKGAALVAVVTGARRKRAVALPRDTPAETKADTGTGHRASVASATNGLAGPAKGTALPVAATGAKRTRAVVPHEGLAAGMTAIPAMPDGDRGAVRRMIPFPGVAVEGPRSGLPVGSGVMMTVPFGAMTLTA